MPGFQITFDYYHMVICSSSDSSLRHGWMSLLLLWFSLISSCTVWYPAASVCHRCYAAAFRPACLLMSPQVEKATPNIADIFLKDVGLTTSCGWYRATIAAWCLGVMSLPIQFISVWKGTSNIHSISCFKRPLCECHESCDARDSEI